MLTRILVFTLALSTLVLAAPSSDQSWVVNTYRAGATALQLGQLARTKASSPQVKAFATRMTADYASANTALKQLAAKKGISLAGGNPAGDDAVKHLNGLSGKKFDREYARMMALGHKKALSSFQDEAREGGDPAVKSFAQKTLPRVQANSTEADNLQNAVSVFR